MIIAVNLHYERIDKNRPKDRQTKWQKKKKAEEAFSFLQLYIVGHLSKILFNNLWHTDNKTRRLFFIRVRTRILAARWRTCGQWPKKNFQHFGSTSFWHESGSGSLDSHLGKVDPDPRIYLSVIVVPDPRIHYNPRSGKRNQSGSGARIEVNPDPAKCSK